jgi:hypothetical protein
MQKNKTTEMELIRKKAGFYKTLSIFLACVILFFCLFEAFRYVRYNYQALGLIDADKKGPHYKQIKQIIEPLRYSGLKILLDAGTRLSVDFENKKWFIHNVRRFDKNGNIVLKEGRYGLCGDLAIYTYEKILPLFEDKYSIEFLRAAESNFFPVPNGSHIVLMISDKSFSIIPDIYIIDPSFRIYKRAEYFEDYIFFPTEKPLDLHKDKKKYETLPINTQYPILIRNDFMVGIAIDSVDGKFDKQNYAIFLSATKRHRYFSRTIFSLRKKDGIVEKAENKDLALKVLSKQEFEDLRERLSYFFYNIQ